MRSARLVRSQHDLEAGLERQKAGLARICAHLDRPVSGNTGLLLDQPLSDAGGEQHGVDIVCQHRAAMVMAITIIGLPWAKAAFTIAAYTLLPFGQKAVRRDALTGRPDIGTGPLGLIGNAIWLLLAGWWLALAHIITAVILAVTIVGIPFAWAHLKLAGLALWPIGKEIVPA